jgi:hypothetical protein
MAKKAKKQETAVQAENVLSNAAESLLTQESTDPSNAPQIESGEELQKPEPEKESELTEKSEIELPATEKPETESPADQRDETEPETESPPDQRDETEPLQESLPSLDQPQPETLEPEPEDDAVLRIGQCPRCKHINSKRAFIFPGVNRVAAPGVYEGVKYQIVETRRTKCEKCGQVFFIKKYL